MRLPKVLVGCPTSFHKEYCLDKYIEGIKSLTYKNFDFLLVDNSKDDVYFEKIKSFGVDVVKGPWFDGALDRIVNSRNILRQKVLDGEYDYYLSLEQDVIPPKDIIQRMLKHQKDIVVGIYFVTNKRSGGSTFLTPLVFKLSDKDKLTMKPISKKEFESNKLLEVVSAGLGCVMIHKNVLKEIKFRYESKSTDDRFFFLDCLKKDFKVFCDTSIVCKHYINRPHNWEKIDM